MIKPDRPQMTIWRKRFTCWINKAIDTHSEYVIFIAQCYGHKYISFLVNLFSDANLFLVACQITEVCGVLQAYIACSFIILSYILTPTLQLSLF